MERSHHEASVAMPFAQMSLTDFGKENEKTAMSDGAARGTAGLSVPDRSGIPSSQFPAPEVVAAEIGPGHQQNGFNYAQNAHRYNSQIQPPRKFATPVPSHQRRRGNDFRRLQFQPPCPRAPIDKDRPSVDLAGASRPLKRYEPAEGENQSAKSGDKEMADVDARPDFGGRRGGGGGGGGGGYHNNRKRRHREEDDFDRRPTRRRFEEPPVAKLRRGLLNMGDSGMRDPVDEVKGIAKGICDNYDSDEEIREGVLDLMVQLVVEQPFKIPLVAAVALYANETKAEVGKSVLKKAATNAQVAAEKGEWRDFKLLLRLLACSQSLLEGDGVFPVLDELFNRAVDLQAASPEDAVGLELVKIILLTLPYVLATPVAGFEQKTAELLERTDIVASTPHPFEPLVEVYSGGDEKPFPFYSVLGLLQKQLQAEAANGWDLAFISRLYKPSKPDEADDMATEPPRHPLPTIAIPSPVNPGPKPLFPEAYFSLYADQDIETVPPTTSLAASVVRDAIVDTINILHYNRTAAAKFLIELDCYWAPETFVKRATPFDKLGDIPPEKSTWKPEDMAVDALFSQIMFLPTAEQKLVYYHSVITESCKIAPAAIAPSLGRAIRFLFKNSGSMDLELIARFMDWFAHHMSNFEFRWKWTEWIDDVDRPSLDPKKSYIIGAIDKEIRLSFAKRIRETLPAPYHHLITEGKEKDIPDFKFANETTPFSQEGKALLGLLRKKAPEADIQPIIDSIHEQAQAQGIEDVLVPSTDAYVTCICFIGSKSLSHVLSCIERCKERLLGIGPSSEAARRQIIASVAAYWREHPGVAVNIVDKLLNYTILSPTSVAAWALGPPAAAATGAPFGPVAGSGRQLADTWVYEMVAGTVFKVTNRVRQIVAARAARGLPQEQVDLLADTLAKEREAMRLLFAAIDAAATETATADDAALDAADEAEGAMIRAWAARWARVFRRKAAVEEAVVGDAAIEAKIAAAAVAAEAEEARDRAREAEREAEAARKKSEAEAAAAAAAAAVALEGEADGGQNGEQRNGDVEGDAMVEDVE